jgi:chromobox protein 1
LLAAVKKWSPPSGSWEDEIEKIDGCEEDDNGKLIVYLIWKNGQKTNHVTQIIYKKCPQKVVHSFVIPIACRFRVNTTQMLQFYEEHVRIIGKEKCYERRHEGL